MSFKSWVLSDLDWNRMKFPVKLLGISEMVRYEKGQRTDVVDALRYTVVLLGGSYETVDVKVKSLVSPFDGKDIDFVNEEIFVEFNNLEGIIRGRAVSSNYAELQVSWTAESIRVLNMSKSAKEGL